jgi:hypothetical protein
MCFFNSQMVKAKALAKRYGRQMSVIEMAEEILREQEEQVPKHWDSSPPLPTQKGRESAIAGWGIYSPLPLPLPKREGIS